MEILISHLRVGDDFLSKNYLLKERNCGSYQRIGGSSFFFHFGKKSIFFKKWAKKGEKKRAKHAYRVFLCAEVLEIFIRKKFSLSNNRFQKGCATLEKISTFHPCCKKF